MHSYYIYRHRSWDPKCNLRVRKKLLRFYSVFFLQISWEQLGVWQVEYKLWSEIKLQVHFKMCLTIMGFYQVLTMECLKPIPCSILSYLTHKHLTNKYALNLYQVSKMWRCGLFTDSDNWETNESRKAENYIHSVHSV